MRKAILIITIFLCTVVYGQESLSPKSFSRFNFGLYAGPNFSFPMQIGYLVLLEAKTNISSAVNIKASIGFTSAFEDINKMIKGYKIFISNNINKYNAYLSDVEKYEYSIVPLSAGVEYCFQGENYSPYLFAEGGYNIYTVEVHTKTAYGKGSYNSVEEIPFDYRNKYPVVPTKDSYRLGFGIGVKIKIAKDLGLDIRYIYNANSNIINYNQILVGLSI